MYYIILVVSKKTVTSINNLELIKFDHQFSYAFPIKIRFQETLLLIYRIMFKEHNLKLTLIIYRHFLAFVLIYFLFLNIVIENSVNTR